MMVVLRHVWQFVTAVLQQWAALVTGGVIVAVIALYERASERPFAGRLFWAGVIISLVAAVFLAWRKERLAVESLTLPRPDFFYEGSGSRVTPHLGTNSAGKPIVQIEFLLRFINKGRGTAYNLSSKIYGCWINDVPRKAELADSTQPSVGRTRPDEAKSLGFLAERYARENSSLSIHLKPSDVLLILVEIRFRHRSELESPIFENEPIWKMWDPRIPFRLCDAAEKDVRIAKEAIDALKAEGAIRS
jgi:hypothetical protein